jgi:hypothetical protein
LPLVFYDMSLARYILAGEHKSCRLREHVRECDPKTVLLLAEFEMACLSEREVGLHQSLVTDDKSFRAYLHFTAQIQRVQKCETSYPILYGDETRVEENE